MRRALVVAAVAGLCLAGGAPAFGVFPGRNGRIVYTEYDPTIIHTVLPSGHGDRVIAPGSLNWPALTWSPSGRRIAFERRDDIYTMRADGSDVRRLTFDGGSHPTYGPGGGRIVFNGHGGIETIRWDGSHRRVINKRNGAVTWSPNGQIVYKKYKHGARPGGDRAELWAMRPNGTHRRRLVSLGGAGGSLPIYSPDGSEFLFIRFRGEESSRTLLADANGDNIGRPPCVRALSFRGSRYGDYRVPITYSPDGRWFLVYSVGGYPGGGGNLIRVSLSSCAGKRVVGPLAWEDADWQALPAP